MLQFNPCCNFLKLILINDFLENSIYGQMSSIVTGKTGRYKKQYELSQFRGWGFRILSVLLLSVL